MVTASEGADRRLEAGLGAQSSDRSAGTGEWSVGRLVAGVWAVGFLLFFSVTLCSHLAARRLTVHNVKRCPTSALQRFTALSVKLGIKHSVRLVMSSTIRVPATWGLWRSTVVLPVESGTWARETRDRGRVHELAQVRRGACGGYLLPAFLPPGWFPWATEATNHGHGRGPIPAAHKCRYVALLLYPWVIFGLGVVVGGCRGRVGRGRCGVGGGGIRRRSG